MDYGLASSFIHYAIVPVALTLAIYSLSVYGESSKLGSKKSLTSAFIVIYVTFIASHSLQRCAEIHPSLSLFEVSPLTFKVSSLLHLFAFAVFVGLASAGFFRIHSLSPEGVCGLIALPFLWSAALMSRHLFALILFLELASLVAIILFAQSRPSRTNATAAPSQNNVVGALITFLWLSIISLILIMLGFSESLPSTLNADLTKISVTSLPLSTSSSILLGCALSLKFMLVPWGSLLFSLYQRLPYATLVLYLTAYYPAFLSISLFVFVPLLQIFCGWLLVYLSGALAFTFVFAWKRAFSSSDVRSLLAVSSLFNICLLCVVAVLSL